MATDAMQEDTKSEIRAAARQIWEGWQSLKNAQDKWNAQDFTNTMDVSEAGENAGIPTAHLGSVAFDTANAISAVMAAGHATNITNIL